jgi:ABC-type amino acid transport substrate-binding protein
MKKASAFLLGLTLASGAAAKEVITIGYFELPPWVTTQPGGKPSGLAVEYWEKTLAPAMAVSVDWVGPISLLRLLQKLEAGELDAGLIMSKAGVREKILAYPTSPFVEFQPTLAVLQQSTIAKVQSAADLAGKRIGYFPGAVVPPLLKDSRITLDLDSSPTWLQDNLNKLLASRIDAVLDLGVESMIYLTSKGGNGDKVRFVPLPVPPVPLYTAFARSPHATALAAKYDPAHGQNLKAFKARIQAFVSSAK